MVMERLDAAGRHPENQDPTKQFAISAAKRLLRDAKVKDPGPKEPAQRNSSRQNETITSTELDLNAEWERQAHRYVGLGYYVELAMTAEDYLDSLPKFKPQPEAYKGRLDTPLLVETRIGPDRQFELAGLTNYLKESGLAVQNWPQDPKGYKTPEAPYTTWANDPAQNRNRKVVEVRKTLPEDERGGTRLDGVALYLKNPAKLKEVYIDLPGDSVESVNVPDLSLWDGQPYVHYNLVDYASPRWGSLVCGRE